MFSQAVLFGIVGYVCDEMILFTSARMLAATVRVVAWNETIRYHTVHIILVATVDRDIRPLRVARPELLQDAARAHILDAFNAVALDSSNAPIQCVGDWMPEVFVGDRRLSWSSRSNIYCNSCTLRTL